MIYDLADFDNPDFLILCYYLKDNITLADISIILFDGINTIILIFVLKIL